MANYGTSQDWREQEAAQAVGGQSQVPEVQRQLELLEKRQNALQNTIDDLAKRLSPVMRPEALTDKRIGEIEKQPLTPLAQSIQTARSRLEAQTAQLRAFIDLLEI